MFAGIIAADFARSIGGTPVPLLPAAGTTLLERTLDACSSARIIDNVLVGTGPGASESARTLGLPFHAISRDYLIQADITAVRKLLHRNDLQGFIILSAAQPLVTQKLLAGMLQVYWTSSSVLMVVPEGGIPILCDQSLFTNPHDEETMLPDIIAGVAAENIRRVAPPMPGEGRIVMSEEDYRMVLDSLEKVHAFGS